MARGPHAFEVLEERDDGLAEIDAVEAIANAVAIYKTLRSRSPHRSRPREKP